MNRDKRAVILAFLASERAGHRVYLTHDDIAEATGLDRWDESMPVVTEMLTRNELMAVTVKRAHASGNTQAHKFAYALQDDARGIFLRELFPAGYPETYKETA